MTYEKTFFDSTEDIPADFREIDSNPAHWCMVEYAGKTWVVPNTDARNDMTDAMMSEIPGLDDVVTPVDLSKSRFWGFCMAFLLQDGDLAVPGGRYGRDTDDCAPFAIYLARIMQYHQGEPITYYSLNSDMSSVVNSSDDVAKTISESGYILKDDGVEDVRELLDDEYVPQSAADALAKWLEEHSFTYEQTGDRVVIDVSGDNIADMYHELSGEDWEENQ